MIWVLEIPTGLDATNCGQPLFACVQIVQIVQIVHIVQIKLTTLGVYATSEPSSF